MPKKPSTSSATMNALTGVCVGGCVMSEAAETEPAQSNPTTKRNNQADRQAFAQVEKWMAMIRELSLERQAQTG